MLKPQDLLVAVVLGRHPAQQFEPLARAAGLSLSEAHSAVRRLQASDLVSPDRHLNITLFVSFMESGARFVWPQRSLGVGPGLPTAGAAPVLGQHGLEYGDLPPVWSADGVPSERLVRGVVMEPLYKTMARAALQDDEIYALYALLEGARSRSARERSACVGELRRRLMSFTVTEPAGVHS